MNAENIAAIRSAIDSFLSERLHAKVERLDEHDPKRDKLIAQFQRETWIEDAARRVKQIQLATHLIKAIHPSARGSNLFVPPDSLPDSSYVGTRQLGSEYDSDVVGNAAALDVYKFLQLEHDRKTLLSRAIAYDPELTAALSSDPDKAKKWVEAFAGITEARGEAASHTLAKQLYFPLDNGQYHLLAPLYPTALIHRINRTIREHRFSDEAKKARQARREEKYAPHGTYDYPQMAVQKLGGTKPQNISQLNSERYGDNYLLASLPPNWKSQGIKPPLNIDTAFRWFRRRYEVRRLSRQLRHYLSSLPTHRSTIEMRETRSTLTRALYDELLQFAAEFKLLQPGWSDHEDCRIPDAQKYWLDPYRAEFDEDFCTERNRTNWHKEISTEFAAWLNSTLRTDRLRMSDSEYSHWRGVLEQELKLVEEEVRYGA